MAEQEKRTAMVSCFVHNGRACLTSLNDESVRLTANAACSLLSCVPEFVRTLRFRSQDSFQWQCSWNFDDVEKMDLTFSPFRQMSA
jgi:hypothetical protein